MNHQPFETWLLSEEPLSPEQASELAEHLAGCQHCQQVQAAWLSVAQLFSAVPPLDPAPGFVQRWQERLAVDRALSREMRQRWQSWILLIGIANAAAFILVLMGLQFYSTYDSLMEYLLSLVYRGAATLTLITGVQNLFATLLRTIPGIVPLSWWIVLIVLLCVGSLAWVVALTKITKIASLSRRVKS